MKKFLSLAIFAFLFSVVCTYAQNAMMIKKKSGYTFGVKTEELDSITVANATTLSSKLYWQDSVDATVTDTLYEGIPSGMAAHDYSGERISFDNDKKYEYQVIANNCVAGQSGAAYGKYLFVVKDRLAAIYMYNLDTKKLVYTLALTAHTETTSSSSTTVLYHCNQTTFGTTKYDESDPFPLMYISERAPSSTGRCFVVVLRIVPTLNAAKTEYTSFKVEQVQTIYLPKETVLNALGNANFTIDSQTGNWYTYSRCNSSWSSNYQYCRVTQFTPVTDLSKSEVYLESSNIKDTYEIYELDGKTHISALNMQGAFIWNQKMYIAQGYPSCGFIYLRIVDLAQRKLVNDIDLLADGFNIEPEGCFLYNGNITFCCNGAPIYTFHFK